MQTDFYEELSYSVWEVLWGFMSAYDRRSISVYKGYIGERLAEKFLEKQGFEVMSYMILTDFISQYLRGRRSGPYYEFYKEFLGSKRQDFSELIKVLNKLYAGPQHKRRRFDFVAKRENKYYVVAVKTDGGRLSELEKKELEMSKKFGFSPILIRTNITLIANLENVTMEML